MPDQHADIRLYLVVHESLHRTLDRFVRATERLDPTVLADVIGSRWALFARGLHSHREHEDDDFFPMMFWRRRYARFDQPLDAPSE